MIVFLWCFFWFFLCWSLESLSPFYSNNHTRSFRRAYISRHVSKGDSNTSFLNEILYLVNPHDKLSTFVLYPSLGFLSIHRLTLWDSRLGHELWRSQSFAWSEWDTSGSSYACSWTSIPHVAMWHLHLLCERSHTLSLCLVEMRNCSCAHLIS
jgi:hypothetical protein